MRSGFTNLIASNTLPTPKPVTSPVIIGNSNDAARRADDKANEAIIRANQAAERARQAEEAAYEAEQRAIRERNYEIERHQREHQEPMYQ